MSPGMHIYAHPINCQTRFGPHIIHGVGRTMEQEGRERTNKHLSKSIGLTQRETHGNRKLDIALVVEDFSHTKITGLVEWTAGIFII